ncbi:MAG: FIST C-terminal domain-containing protein [Burkholderiales bacterium]|nr:FIST C-terminal domain-containing protein [Burkholderiales bacterium]
MRIAQCKIQHVDQIAGANLPPETQLLLIFGARNLLQHDGLFVALKQACPAAHIAGCSTAGEICGTEVSDNTIVLTSICFTSTQIRLATVAVPQAADSRQAGLTLSAQLQAPHLRHILVFSDGMGVNGSELVQGLRERLPANVNVTGGLAGDGADFQETVVLGDGPARAGQIVGVGFYGEELHIGYGSVGGWDVFGPERMITRSEGNVLYELDGESALALYKTYLGKHAQELPSSGLLFPLALRLPDAETPVVRTILGVDEAQQSMTFAGAMPEGCMAQLMKANFNRLVDGAIGAAEVNRQQLGEHKAELAVLISCIGRKLVLRQRIEEETEGVADILGTQAVLTGFYSYGELAPHGAQTRCELHNQTMTVTTFSEK